MDTSGEHDPSQRRAVSDATPGEASSLSLRISHVSTKGSVAASALSTTGLAATTLAADTPTRMLFRNPALLVRGLFGAAVMVNPEHRTSIISTKAVEEASLGRAKFAMVLLCCSRVLSDRQSE